VQLPVIIVARRRGCHARESDDEFFGLQHGDSRARGAPVGVGSGSEVTDGGDGDSGTVVVVSGDA
jgi:hypothetical protein